jgi:hypothetical protein
VRTEIIIRKLILDEKAMKVHGIKVFRKCRKSSDGRNAESKLKGQMEVGRIA